MGARVHVAADLAGQGMDWGVRMLAGRFVELWGGPDGAALTVCAGLVREAQASGALAAWVDDGRSSFFPPDFAAWGVDLAALAVVRAGDAAGLWRGCDLLLRSGAFGLVVADAGEMALPLGMQSRLAGLAQRHQSALLALTRGRAGGGAGRGSLVSLRVTADKRRAGSECFVCRIRGVKDKRRAPGWTHEEYCHGPDGLC